jgi:hypothetical protein
MDMSADSSEHIEDLRLELYHLERAQLPKAEAEAVRQHLARCHRCRQQVASLEAFYLELRLRGGGGPTETDLMLVRRLGQSDRRVRATLPSSGLARYEMNAIDAYAEVIEPSPAPLATRIVRYIRFRPVQVVVTSSVALAAALLAFLLFRPAVKDSNPAFARIQDYLLSVYNQNSEVLWTRSVLGVADQTVGQHSMASGVQRIAQLGDLDGDGRNEVLLSGVNRSGAFTADSLYCYEFDGSLRWGVNIGEIPSFGDTNVVQHLIPMIMDFTILRRRPDSSPQLFVVSNEVGFSPSKLSEIDPSTGRELHAYYNRGGCGLLLHADIDKDGQEELFLAGINDSYNNAFLAVLNPARIDGHAPVTDRHLPGQIPAAQEIRYLLFPLSIFGQQYSNQSYSLPNEIRMTSRGLVLCTILELLRLPPFEEFHVQLVYTLDSSILVSSIAAGDGFIKAEELLLKQGYLAKPLLPTYLIEMRDSVRYWDSRNQKFVHAKDLTGVRPNAP